MHQYTHQYSMFLVGKRALKTIFVQSFCFSQLRENMDVQWRFQLTENWLSIKHLFIRKVGRFAATALATKNYIPCFLIVDIFHSECSGQYRNYQHMWTIFISIKSRILALFNIREEIDSSHYVIASKFH